MGNFLFPKIFSKKIDFLRRRWILHRRINDPIFIMIKGGAFRLSRNNYEQNMMSSFRDLRAESDLFDITLCVSDPGGEFRDVRAHRVILSACSAFFKKMFRQQEAQLTQSQNPYMFLKGVSYNDLTSLLDFMYQGEVNVADKDLDNFLAISEELEVEGLQNTRDKGRSYLNKTKDEDTKPTMNFGMKKKLVNNKIPAHFLDIEEDEGINLPNELTIDIADDQDAKWNDTKMNGNAEGDYSSAGKYAEHYYKVPGDIKLFQCKLCSHTGKTTQIIKDHISLEHFPRDVPCDLCGTVLRGDGPLRNHMYQCAKKAGKKFSMNPKKAQQ